MILLDDWQKEFIAYEGNKILVAGRQTGKSEAQGFDNANFTLNNPKSNTLILSKTERQAEELLIKTMNFLLDVAPKRIGKGKLKPLKHSVWVYHPGKNTQSRVMCLPVGIAGEGIKGFTIHKLSVDEAQLPEDAMYYNISPMLLTTGGKMSLSGTPRGRKGFFWEAYQNKNNQFKVFRVNTEEVIKNRPISESWKEWQREAALEHLRLEKARMPAKWYAQEYLAEFVEDLNQFFPDDTINKAAISTRRAPSPGIKYYLGVDVGRFIDPTTFQIIAKIGEQHVHVESISRVELSIPQTAQLIENLDSQYHFKKIGIDSGGLGVGVCDILNLKPIGDRVEELNNSKRLQARREDKKGKLLKEGMYINTLANMQTGKLIVLEDNAVIESLKSIQIDYGERRGEPIIFSTNNHITEGLIRADWIASQDKSLKLWCFYN